MLPHFVRSLDQSLALYRRLVNFWNLHLEAADPDLRQLRDIHNTLCRLELELQPEFLDECVQNLQIRLRQAGQLSLELPLPLWSANALDDLEIRAAEVKA